MAIKFVVVVNEEARTATVVPVDMNNIAGARPNMAGWTWKDVCGPHGQMRGILHDDRLDAEKARDREKRRLDALDG